MLKARYQEKKKEKQDAKNVAKALSQKKVLLKVLKAGKICEK